MATQVNLSNKTINGFLGENSEIGTDVYQKPKGGKGGYPEDSVKVYRNS
jgi:hypothetical protein